MTHKEFEKLRDASNELQMYAGFGSDGYSEMSNGLVDLAGSIHYLSAKMQVALNKEIEDVLAYHKEHCTIIKRQEMETNTWYELKWDN